MNKIGIIHYGLGAMGCSMVRIVTRKQTLQSMGAVCRAYPEAKDAAKVKAGRDLGEVAELGRTLGVVVSDDPDEILNRAGADVVLHATSSSMAEVENQIIASVSAGLNAIVVSQSNLVYPWAHYPEIGQRIDEAAKKNKVTVLFTGVNPGFIMDFVPIVFTGVCAEVNSIQVKRVVDYSPFGAGSIESNGFGISVEAYREKIKSGEIDRIVASSPCVDMIADVLGWELDETRMTVEPLTSKKHKKTPFAEIEPGLVCGFRRIFHGIKDGLTVITLDTIGMLNPDEDGFETGDSTFIKGEPNVDLVVRGELAQKAGAATAAHAVNSIPQVMAAEPGLVTVKDLPPAVAISTRVPN